MGAKARTPSRADPGVTVADARRTLLGLAGVAEGRSYGYPAFLVHGRFLARFRDDDTVLVLRLPTIDDRAFLMKVDPAAFFFTEHYRDYPAVLVRLRAVARRLLTTVIQDAWKHEATLPAPRRRKA